MEAQYLNAPFRSALEKTTLAEFLATVPRHCAFAPVVLDTETTVGAALDTLRNKSITSAPVLATVPAAFNAVQKEKIFYGFVDVACVINAFLESEHV